MSAPRTGSIGILAVAVGFGFVYGVVLWIQKNFSMALYVWGLAVFVISITLAREMSTRLLIVTIAAFVCSGALVYSAAVSERTGTAVYYESLGKPPVTYPVKREDDPKKFREATNLRWVTSIFFAGIGAVTFLFHRRFVSADA
jgi:hypothetical protein